MSTKYVLGTVLKGCSAFSLIYRTDLGDLPSGAVVKNPPANARDMGSSPGPGRSHMLRSN